MIIRPAIRWLYNSWLRGEIMLYSYVPSGYGWSANITSLKGHAGEPFDFETYPNWGHTLMSLWYDLSIKEPDNSMPDLASSLWNYDTAMVRV